jgi:hypothetical protein
MRNELIRLRFKEGLPFAQIARDAGVSPDQLKQAYKFEASETIWRRIDAYLDAGDLHKVSTDNRRIARIMKLNREMWTRYRMVSIPERDVRKLSIDRQKRLEIGMHNRLKKVLRAEAKEKTGQEPWFGDGESYWRCKAKVLARFPQLASDGDTGFRERTRTVVPGKPVHRHRNEKRDAPG